MANIEQELSMAADDLNEAMQNAGQEGLEKRIQARKRYLAVWDRWFVQKYPELADFDWSLMMRSGE